MKNRIVQSYWNVFDKCRDYNYYRMCYASAKSIKQQGYPIVLYTDDIGEKMFENYPFDDIIRLDKAIADVNPRMMAASKYFALMEEPLGTIHIDSDIIITAPCLSMPQDFDCVVQQKHGVRRAYTRVLAEMDKLGYPQDIKKEELSQYPYIFGAIGFNNNELKDRFLHNYFEAVELYKGKPLKRLVDLVLEQAYLPTIVERYNYKPYFLFEDKPQLVNSLSKYRFFKTDGFVHFYGNSKNSRECQEYLSSLLTKDDIRIINNNYLNCQK